MNLLRSILGIVLAAACARCACGDALERIRPEKLRATHEKIESLKSQRRAVSLSSGYDDVRALLHVHSAFSHDSRGTIEEIIAAAKETGVRVIMFSEHPAANYDYVDDGHRGVKDGVLLIPGAETHGFLAYPKYSIQQKQTKTPQEFSDLVRSTGGLVFLCHLEERMDWEIANLTGSEIYNTHADFKDEPKFIAALRSPLTMITLMGAVKQYPQEVFGALLDYPADYLKRYDQLCQKSRLTGVAANDSHHNQAYRAKVTEGGKVLLEDALGKKLAELDPEKITPLKLLVKGKQPGDLILDLDLDPYARSFHHVSTHLLMHEVNEASVWEALRDGRAYVAFDWIADPTGFVFHAETENERWPIGSEVSTAAGLRLRAEAPLDGRFKLVRDGEVILEGDGPSIDVPVDQQGVYRVEVWLSLAGEARPWILTNPIYVRGR
jgi:PHP domain